ncbi:MAG TPA: zinc ribbon domain-containing protein [Chloroflexota bacterium]|jgi:hypothetical protein|nr:zinc ribbon domain-containing protein [Chloroflexota bacterium]
MESIGRVLTYGIALLGAFVAALWLASIVWCFHDIRARTLDIYVRLFAILLVTLLGPFGVALYMVLRPRETLDESYERSLGEEALLREIEQAEYCPTCDHRSHDDYLLCPNCQTQLRTTCPNCDRVNEFHWPICPYCRDRHHAPSGEIDVHEH